MFLDKFKESTIPEDLGAIISLHLCPNKRYILLQSSTSIWITKANDISQKSIFLHQFDEKSLEKYGYARECGWINANSIFILTSKGEIVIFSNQNFSKMKVDRVLSHPSGKQFTTVDSFSSFIIAGDTDGNILILSPETGDVIVKNVSDNSIKKIAISRHNGFILIGDGSLLSFKISQDIIQNSESELQLTPVDFKAAGIVASKYANLAAAYSPNGTVLITNFELNRFIETNKAVSDIQFGVTSTLFIVCSGYVGILYSMQPSVRWYEYCEMKEISNFVVTKLMIVCAKGNTCFIAPIVNISSNSNVPICYTMNEVYEIESNESKMKVIKHEKPDEIRAIKFAVSNGRTIACTGNGVLMLFDIEKQTWVKLQHPTIHSVRGIVWWNSDIAVVVPNQKMHRFSLKILHIIGTKAVLKKSIPLSGCPLAMRSNETTLIVTMTKDVITVKNDDDYTQTKHDIQGTLSDIDPVTGHLFTLAKGRHLVCDGKEILRNVSSFFIDRSTEVLIASGVGNIYACDLKQCTRFSHVGIIDSNICLLGGIVPEKLEIVFFNDKNFCPPEVSSINYFADALAANISDVVKATLILSPHLHEEYVTKQAVKGLSIALTRGKAKEALDFIRAKPAMFGLPPNPRHYASDIIAQLLGTTAEHDKTNKYITFKTERKSIEIDFAPLCKLVRLEEGYVPAACCAILSLRFCHLTKELVDSGFGVIELPFPKDKSGAIPDDVQNKLNRFYAETITVMCHDLFSHVKPSLALYVSRISDVALHICLAGEKEPEFSVIEALSYFATQLNEKTTTKDDIDVIADEMHKCGWKQWEFCALLVNGNIKQAMNVIKELENCNRILYEVKNSQWSHLLEM